MHHSSWFLASCLFLACLFALVHGQIYTFQGPVYYSEPSMGTGVLNGTIYYDWQFTSSSQSPSYFLNFGAQVYSVLYQYNYNRGYNFTTSQWRYRSGPGCPGGCETGAITDWMPQLFVDSAYKANGNTMNINGVNCKAYVPVTTNPSFPISSLWVAASNTSQLCRANFANGNIITFLGMFYLAHPAPVDGSGNTVFTTPNGCACGKPIDMSIVLDRSGSIQYWQFLQMKNFLLNLANTFKISTTQTQWALSHFNTKAWNQVTLAAGNTQTNVLNVINGLKCCKSIRSDNDSCCDGGTSISAGIQLGAWQLNPNAPGVRSFATKVMILLTDGFHNTLADGYQTWCYQSCSNGDPCQTDTNPQDGISDDWETPTKSYGHIATCHRDLINAREFGYYAVGDSLITFAIGVGADVAVPELRMVTDNLFKINPTPTCSGDYNVANCIASKYIPCGGKVTSACMAADLTNPERVITTSDWNSLGSTLLELSSKVCDTNAQPCGQCCGYCACGICSRPDQCPTTNFCDVGVFQGNCCSTAPRVCSPTNACFTATCDRNANNGQGACVQTPVSCQPADACYTYACDPAKGACAATFKGAPAQDKCHISTCDNGVLISNQPKNCSGSDPCRNYTCNLADGSCLDTPKNPPFAAPKCQQWVCTATGLALTNITCPNSGDLCNPLVCNLASGQCETVPVVCNDPTNLCDKTTCNSATGKCNAKTYTQCTAAPCQTNCTCDTVTGSCGCQALTCAPKDSCITRSCNPATNLCVDDFAICPTACVNSNCTSLNNRCFTYKCNGSVSQASDYNNCYIVTNIGASLCQQDKVDNCLTNPRCDNATGCQYDKVVCSTPPNCKEYISNSSYPGCCQIIDKNCDKGDPCYEYGCNATTGECYSNPKCVSPDKCTNVGCFPENGTCWSTPVICTSSDPCQEAQPCDPATGACSTLPKNCSDGDICTADTCVNGNCVHTPCDDGDPCTVNTCDSNGLCLFPPRNCSDNNLCTIDSCNSSVLTGDPCVHVTIPNSKCDDNNKCTDDTCVPDKGCVNIEFNVTQRCSVPNGCMKPACFPTLGCQNISRTCVLNASGLPMFVDFDNSTGQNYTDNSDCSYAECVVDQNTNEGICTKVALVCGSALTTGVITAVALGAGVIVGIIVAILVCVGASGGGAYAAYQKFGGDGEGSLQTNPLYENSRLGGDNPLWESPDA